jgi:riboflavin kinase/FMN adenylyltransferase
MRVYRNIGEVEYEKCTAVTVGTFDGVHLGHREIIRKLNSVADSKGLRKLVVTFEPHPQVVLRTKSPDIRILSTLEEKLSILSSLNVDSVLVIEFTKEFSQTGADEFYSKYLIGSIGMCDLVLGYDHMFGRNREGNFEMMKDLSEKYGFNVDRVDEYKSNGFHISSTAIRRFLDSGNVTEAAKLLDRNYSMSGLVTEGRKLGRELGMPTANIRCTSQHKLIPASGIYAVAVKLNEETFGGVMNIGTNPTVTDDMSVKLEVNIFDFEETIYGETIEVEFIEYLRPEIKFSSLDELKANMNSDRDKAKEITESFLKNKFTKANN